jgi:hypothetical protein
MEKWKQSSKRSVYSIREKWKKKKKGLEGTWAATISSIMVKRLLFMNVD